MDLIQSLQMNDGLIPSHTKDPPLQYFPTEKKYMLSLCFC